MNEIKPKYQAQISIQPMVKGLNWKIKKKIVMKNKRKQRGEKEIEKKKRSQTISPSLTFTKRLWHFHCSNE